MDMNAFAFSGQLIGLCSIILGIFSIINARAKIHYQWAVFCFAMAIWGFGGLGIALASDAWAAVMWWRIAYIGVILIPVTYTHFLFTFLKIKNAKITALLYVITVMFLVLNLYTDLFINNVRYVFDQFYYIDNPTFFYNAFVALFFVMVFYQIIILVRSYSQETGIRRNQIKYFLLITFIGYGGGATAYLPVYHIDIYPILNVLVATFPFIIGYAIFKHRLLDIKVAIQRSILYSITFGLVLLIYVVVVFFMGKLFQFVTETQLFLAAGVTALIGAKGIAPLEKYYCKITDKVFFKDKYDYSTALYDVSEILNKNMDIDVLHDKIENKLRKILKVSFVDLIVISDISKIETECFFNEVFIEFVEENSAGVLMVPEFESMLDKLANSKGVKSEVAELYKIYKCCVRRGVETVVLIKHDKKLLGLITLGSKLSGDIYSRNDLSLLKTFSSQAAVAFEKAQLFEKVSEYSRDLEKKVRKRTKKIKDMQEHQKQMMLEIAHGLQTPLTIIRGKLETLPGVARKNMKVKSLDKSIDRISKFIYDMLHLSNLESGEKRINLAKIDLSDLLRELIESFEIIAAEKNIKITNSIEKNIKVIGDRNEIADLVTNLVSNGTKYMKAEGEKIIDISLKSKENNIIISVRDNGIGIDNKHIPYLFARFHRIDDAAHNISKGTGLGLAICKKIVDRHKGKISVESKPEQGAKFIVELPKA